MRLKRLLVFLALVLLAFNVILSPTPPDKNELSGEYEVKSLLLYRISKFTRWPRPHDSSRPFVISVLGRLPAGEKIALPENVDIYKRKIVIKNIRKLAEAETTDVLFIAPTEAGQLSAILDYCADKPILTVGDTKGFGQKGVIINFFIRKESVSFEINHDAAKKAAMEINSRLYAIATVIRGGKVFNPMEREN